MSNQSYTTTHGKNPKQIHIAHRRSPSELTTLMVEQMSLQRQLEINQRQQQHLISQNLSPLSNSHHHNHNHNHHNNHHSPHAHNHNHHPANSSAAAAAAAAAGLAPPPNRNDPASHRRAQSSITGAMGNFSFPNNPNSSLAPPPKLGHQSQASMGHSRRHSLGLNEAKKAAAQVQAQRAGKDVNEEIDDNDQQPQPQPQQLSQQSQSQQQPPSQSSFKFPSTIIDPPQSPSHAGVAHGSHNRVKSSLAPSPQRSFQFPPKSPQQHINTNQQQFLNPNDLLPQSQPNYQSTGGAGSGSYHERRQSGHYRSNSRSNNYEMNANWRRQQSPTKDNEGFQPPFSPGHRSKGSYSGGGGAGNNSVGGAGAIGVGGPISSLNQSNSGSQGGQPQQGGRKSLFAPYLPQSSIPDLVADGMLVVGTLRVNKKNRSDAYVSTDGLLDADIFICGSKDRNRALEGDLVAVELLSVDEVWSSKREKEEKKRRKDNQSEINDDVHNDASTHRTSTSSVNQFDVDSAGLKRKGSLKQRPTMKKNDDVEVEGQSLLLVEEEEISDEYKPLYAGHVVAVIDRIPGQLFAGTLGLLRPSQQQQKDNNPNSNNNNNNSSSSNNRPKIVWFKPTDKKVPLIAIPTEQAPKDFVENVDNYTNKLFIASIKRWPITSLHPFGTLVGELGNINEPEIEVEAILRDNNFICDEYLNSATGEERDDYELNSVDFDHEFAKRRDFTNDYVLAISETGKFSDSAIHVKRLDEDRIELGVHISDVTKFIKESSSLDKNARKRSTSVFLAQKSVNLLPQRIMQFLSFEKNVKSLAISVLFEIDSTKFEVENIEIMESFIQPKIRLSFDQIDSVLKNEDKISSTPSNYIRTIALISRKFRRQRLENSNLNNDINLTLLDQIDDERIRLHLNLFDSNYSFNVLNDIFLKVNNTVAQRTHSKLGDSTFLRRQGLPTLTKIENFKKKVENFGFEIDTSSSSNLINSILKIRDDSTRKIVEILLYKSLNRSKYFIAGKVEPENYGAYYFNLPLYTHFTSPLRRYADFIAHRQLKQVLTSQSIEEKSSEELDSLKMTAEYCNFKKDCAKSAQDQSIHLLLSKTINEMSEKSGGQLIVFGKISQVYESAFDIFLPEFGIEKRVHGDQLPLKKCEFDKNKGILELYWEKGVDSATFIPEDEKNSLSYRNSIKNKFQISANEIVKLEAKKKQNDLLVSEKLNKELEALSLRIPDLKLNHERNRSTTITDSSSSNSSEDNNNANTSSDFNKREGIEKFFKGLRLRAEGDDYIQEIRELETVPVLLRSEIGMALPCLTVHALNPFINYE